ncbi:MAG: ROK family protein [Leptolyngbyaceae cyanobacterium SM1_4_3]|nr:ROK family protein [Leptolyngbyaceae cyanobacterium SM1_4_3]
MATKATYTLVADTGGTFIKTGLLKNGELIGQSQITSLSSKGLKARLCEMELSFDQLMADNNIASADLLGIGFSFAGLVDPVQNRILSTNQKYDDGPETDLVAWAREKWGLPLFAMNDARMALLGEWKHGAAQGCDNLVMVTLGTGMGSAVLINGELLIGKHFQAGNLGGALHREPQRQPVYLWQQRLCRS